MAKENLSYVIKRIISFFHTPQHDAVHIEKTRSMGMVGTLSPITIDDGNFVVAGAC